jgi:hypothetical protein
VEIVKITIKNITPYYFVGEHCPVPNIRTVPSIRVTYPTSCHINMTAEFLSTQTKYNSLVMPTAAIWALYT